MSSYASRRTGGGSTSSQKRAANERTQQILKTLLKDPANKFCADCKVSGHPRWASWSLGIFVCIRCSGIHRSMGTHISKVRSIDLDSWSDEQVEPLVRWGNKRANLYWEAKLPDGYVPDDSKIENFIRTKYDLKRWVLSPQPPQDPSVLEKNAGESSSAAENQPLSEVQKRLNESKHQAPSHQRQHQQQPPSSQPQQPVPNLLDGSFMSSRAPPTTATQRQTVVSSGNTTSLHHRTHSNHSQQPQHQQPPQQAKPQPPPKPSSSLIGLDFGAPAAPVQQRTQTQGQSAPSAAASSAQQTSRPDLKKSILSLYSSPAPSYQRQQQQQQQPMAHQTHHSTPSGGSNLDILSGFGNISLNTNISTASSSTNSTNTNNLNGLSFNSPSSPTAASQYSSQPQQKKPSAFDDLLSGGASTWSSLSSQKSPTTTSSNTNSYSSNNSNTMNHGFSSFQQPASQQHQQQSNQFSSFGGGNNSNTNNSSTGGFTNEWGSMNSAAASQTKPVEDDLFANVWK